MHSARRYYANVPRNKTLKELLAINITLVMDERKLTQAFVVANAKKNGHSINQTTVGRTKNAMYPATVDTVEAIASGLGVQPWQLLLPGLDAKAIPQSAPAAVELERDRQQIEQIKESIAGLSPKQRDMFVRDNIVQDILAKPYYPPEKMGAGWDASKKTKRN